MDFPTIQRIASSSGAKSAEDIIKFARTIQFLADNPELIAKSRGKKAKPDLQTTAGLADLAQRFFAGRNQRVILQQPKTIPDAAVGLILQSSRGYSDDEIEYIKVWHQESMAAENILGILLEMYIASEVEHYGWIWCSGEVVKSVDFIRHNMDTGWEPLQIKNRSNSENSSSSAIRNGTDIKKWFRSFSNRDATNWEAFPEPELIGLLTEKGFQEFIKNYLG